MTVTIELPPEIEAALIAQAEARGLPLSEYLRSVLWQQVPDQNVALSPAERTSVWRETAKGFPHTPPLSDEAISRESIYGDRG